MPHYVLRPRETAEVGRASRPPQRSPIYPLEAIPSLPGIEPSSFWRWDQLRVFLRGRQAAGSAESQSFSSAGIRFQIDPVNDPARGPNGAPISIVEFGDYNCPYCQRWHREGYEELLAAYPEQILFTYVDFPMMGGGAIGFEAALAANCAEEQCTFWEYHDALFSGAYPLDPAGFEGARELGLDNQALLECIDTGRFAREIQADLEYGANIGVNGTATFFTNGIPMIGAQPLLRFVEVINGELGQ